MMLVEDLPSTYDRIAAAAQSLRSAVNYYETFVTFILGK